MKTRFLSVCGIAAGTVLAFAGAAQSQGVTFQQVLNNPDDPALNLEYARGEIASGRLQQAASALERLLLSKPNWDSVRLLYAVVLFRMDDLEGSRRELITLEGRGLSQKQESDRIRYLQKIDQLNSPLRLTGQISVGGRFDSNPGLVSDRIANAVVDPFGAGDLEFPVDGMTDGDDFAVIANSRLKLEGDINDAPGSTWFVQVDGNFVDFSDIDRADTLSGSVKAGLSLKADRLTVTPYFKASQASLQQERFNERWGGGVKVKYRVDPSLSFFASVEHLNENYQTTVFSPNNDQRDGDITSAYFGATVRLTEKQSVTVAGFTVDKDSDVNPGYSYDQSGFSINALTLLGGGAYLSLSARYSEVEYDQPDGNLNSPFAFITREDDRLFARAAIGAPLQTISDNFGSTQQLPEFFKDVVMQVGVSWSEQSSSNVLVDYENVSGDVLFTKKFAF
jgi:hypothetical protein